jgi:DNA-binding transcriptional LysR family regulator
MTKRFIDARATILRLVAAGQEAHSPARQVSKWTMAPSRSDRVMAIDDLPNESPLANIGSSALKSDTWQSRTSHLVGAMSNETARVYFKGIRPQQFQALGSLARGDGFAGAGESLGLSRSSVWRQIRALERELGCELVRLQGRQVHITEAGRILLGLVVPLMKDFDNVRAEFHNRLQGGQRLMRVAAPYQLLIYEFPPAIERLTKLHPWLQVRLASEPSNASLGLLLRNEADVAVIGQAEGLHQQADLNCYPVTTYNAVLLAPPGHPLARNKKWVLRDLAKHPLILPNAQTTSRVRFDAAFARAGLLDRLQVVLECSTLTTVLPYVRRGFGIGFHSVSHLTLPELEVMQRKGEIEWRLMNDVFGDETVFFVTRKSQAHLPHVEDFRRLLRESAPA